MKRLRKKNIAISKIRPNLCLKDCVLLPSTYKVQVHKKLLRHKIFAHARRNLQSQSFETRNFFIIYGIMYTDVTMLDDENHGLIIRLFE